MAYAFQGSPKAPPATKNASQKSSGGDKIRKLGDKVYLFVLRENKCIKPIKTILPYKTAQQTLKTRLYLIRMFKLQ